MNDGLVMERWKRMRPLLEYPALGHDPIDFTKEGVPIMSNCFGTVIYIMGGGKAILENQVDKWGVPLVFLPGDLPGYVDSMIAESILKEHCDVVSSSKPWDFVSFWKDGRMNHLGVMGG